MVHFIIKRLAYSALVLVGVTMVVFFLFNVLPADPARMVLGQRADMASIEAINKDLGRDKPLITQFLIYLNDVSPLSIHHRTDKSSGIYLHPDKYGPKPIQIHLSSHYALVLKAPYLRRSYQTQRKVADVLGETLPNTAILAITSMFLATVVGIALGIWASLYKNSWIDYCLQLIAIVGTAAPSFFAAIIITWFFGFVLHEYTGLNMTGNLYEIDPFQGEQLVLKNLILPTVALGIRPLAIVLQLTRSSMLDELSKDYIRTAKAKGLSKYGVVVGHALRNALNPVVTAISGWFASLMAGAFFIEYIFGWRGIGKVTVDALDKFDFPVVMGSLLYVAVIFVVVNIIVDILYGLLDPRIRVQ